MEVKFNQYFQSFPYLFYFEVILNHRAKLTNLKLLVQEFHKTMNYNNDIF